MHRRCTGPVSTFARKCERVNPSALSTWVQGAFGSLNQKGLSLLGLTLLIYSCGRWDLNPHERIAHKILSLARLPVPTLPRTSSCDDFVILSLPTHFFNLFIHELIPYFSRSTLPSFTSIPSASSNLACAPGPPNANSPASSPFEFTTL